MTVAISQLYILLASKFFNPFVHLFSYLYFAVLACNLYINLIIQDLFAGTTCVVSDQLDFPFTQLTRGFDLTLNRIVASQLLPIVTTLID